MTMATKESQQAAILYLQEQAKIISKYGDSPKLSGKRYNDAVKRIAETFESVATSK
jgi:hypothetical protein